MHNYALYVCVCVSDVCECASNSGDLQQSSTVKICIGTSLSPCICNSSGCRVSYILNKFYIIFQLEYAVTV